MDGRGAGPDPDGASGRPGVPQASAEAPPDRLLPTITLVQTGSFRRNGRDVAVYAVVSERHGVLVRGLSLAGARTFATQHLSWVARAPWDAWRWRDTWLVGPDW